MFAAAFALCLLIGLAVTYGQALLSQIVEAPVALSVGVSVALLATQPRFWRAAWHLLANVLAFERPRRIGRPWVVDGDTIDDLASSVRYRLANIDAPETGDNAKCFNERTRGQWATAAAIRLVRSASLVEVRRTFRTDQYGRRVAFVLVDGRDLGDELLKLGLARPWRGQRRKWCGPRGGLAKIAKQTAVPFSCHACKRWR